MAASKCSALVWLPENYNALQRADICIHSKYRGPIFWWEWQQLGCYLSDIPSGPYLKWETIQIVGSGNLSVFGFGSFVKILEYVGRNLLIYWWNLDIRTSMFLSYIDRGCRFTIYRFGVPAPILSIRIYHHTITICLFHEQQWTRSSFALVQSFAETF